MHKNRYLQLDVFADRPGGGNPLGVVLGADEWSPAAMQSFAAWTGLVETTFLLRPTSPEADYRVRIHTPVREIPFAGHPTVGSAHAALESGLARGRAGLLVQECAAGLLPIRIEGDDARRVLSVRAPPARILREGRGEQPLLDSIVSGAAPGRLGAAFIEGGRRWWLAELAAEATVRNWRPDHAAIAELARADDALGLCVFARATNPEYELVVRAFPAGVGIVEDPASGAANGLIGAFIALREPDGALARGYRVSQGRELGRDARIRVRIEGSDAVWVGGRTHTVLDAALRWPGEADR